MALSLFLAAAMLAVPARAEERYSLPALPVMVSLSGDGILCGSPELLSHLNYRFLHVVASGDGDDLQLTCSESSSQLVLDVRDGSKGIGRFRIERSGSSKTATTAYLAAHAVAKDKEVVAAALNAYVERNARLADIGAQELQQGNWSAAADDLNRSLESELKPATLYYWLYRAEAEMGHPVRAKWFLAAFLKAQGLKASELTDEQVAPLTKLLRSGAKDDLTQPDADFDAYQAAAAEHDWHRALYQLRQIVARAPWYEPAYVSLAQTYKGIGWKRLAGVWAERAAFAGRLNKDEGLGRDIEIRADDAP